MHIIAFYMVVRSCLLDLESQCHTTILSQNVNVSALTVNYAHLDVFYHRTKKDVQFVNVKMKVKNN